MPEGKPGEFKTSLMGFKKADVLAYVDELAAKSLAEQQEHEQKAAQLQKELDGLRADNDLLMEKTREVCDKLTGEEKRAVDAETRAKALAEQLLHLEETANTYKNRLFTKEQEAVVLKSDNQRLTELLATRQQEIEAARTQAQQAEQARAQERQQAARRQEELEREQANRLEEERARCARQLESEQQAAQREVELGKATWLSRRAGKSRNCSRARSRSRTRCCCCAASWTRGTGRSPRPPSSCKTPPGEFMPRWEKPREAWSSWARRWNSSPGAKRPKKKPRRRSRSGGVPLRAHTARPAAAR